MIDFKLEEDDAKLLSDIRTEAEAGLKYSRYYDDNEEEVSPPRLPEADQFEDQIRRTATLGGQSGVRSMLAGIERRRVDGVSLIQGRIGLGNYALFASGTPDQVKKWGRTMLAMAMTEPGCGSDTKEIRTTARLDGDEWVLNGEKIFVTGGVRSEGVVVWATIDRAAGRGGIKSFLIMKGTPGFEVSKKEKKLGIRGSDTVALVMNDCRIPRNQLLGLNEDIPKKGAGGFKGAMKTFNMTRPATAAGGVGHALGCYDFVAKEMEKEGVTVDYSAGVHQRSAVQDRMIRIEADIEAATLSILRAAWLSDQKQPNNTESSISKAKGGEISRTAPQQCMDLLGGLSTSREFLVEKWLRDARITDIYEGTGEIQRLIIARAILEYGSADLM